MTRMDGKEIMAACNDIITGIANRDFHEAINWGDLRCVAVEYISAWDGHEYAEWVRCVVEEASPTSSKFARHIHEEMAKRGYDVEVATEW